jgi:hypothetical protein
MQALFVIDVKTLVDKIANDIIQPSPCGQMKWREKSCVDAIKGQRMGFSSVLAFCEIGPSLFGRREDPQRIMPVSAVDDGIKHGRGSVVSDVVSVQYGFANAGEHATRL